MGLTQWRSPIFISIQLRGSERKELVIICDLPRCWETEAEDELPELRQHAEKERLNLIATVREATCARGTESYRLHSSTSLSLTVWGRLTAQWQHLALCFPFVKIWLHWITITTSTSCPLRSPPPKLPPSTHSLPPVRSLQLDPLWMTPSQSA